MDNEKVRSYIAEMRAVLDRMEAESATSSTEVNLPSNQVVVLSTPMTPISGTTVNGNNAQLTINTDDPAVYVGVRRQGITLRDFSALSDSMDSVIKLGDNG